MSKHLSELLSELVPSPLDIRSIELYRYWTLLGNLQEATATSAMRQTFIIADAIIYFCRQM